MREATTRRRWLLAASALLALAPSALTDLPLPSGSRKERAPPEAAPRELVATALRVEVGTDFETAWVPQQPLRAEPVLQDQPAPLRLASIKRVPEPAAAWLWLLTLASAAAASRGTRRCLRSPPPR